MTNEQRVKNLSVPQGVVDVVIDTDAFNEIDDQFAIAYLLKHAEKLNTVALYTAPFAPFYNGLPLEDRAKEGMEKSYDEILKVLNLLGEKREVFKGSERYLPDENTFLDSPSARDLAKRAMEYSPEKPLYVIAIAAITNIASALLMNPAIAENIVVVWLGGHAQHYTHTKEFNMWQDVAAARVVMKSGAPFVQLPCNGVVSAFTSSRPELEHWLVGKNDLADYLARNAIHFMDMRVAGTPWSKPIWDVTAVAWLLNEDDKFMESRIMPTYLPGYDGNYEGEPLETPMRYVYHIRRDGLMKDLFEKLTK